jgi:molecular chaperone DnaK (HSP70)
MLTVLLDGRAPVCHKNVDFMVTYGAAYRAHLAQTVEEQEREEAPRSIAVPGTTCGLVQPEPEAIGGDYPAIGIQVVDRGDPVFRTDPSRARLRMAKVIPSGSTVGDFHEEQFATVYANQEAVNLAISYLKHGHNDDETDLEAWQEYKTFNLTGLPPGPAGQAIHVRLRYQAGGMIEGMAWDQSGQEVKIEGKVAGQ